jgi:hypothetical protein
MLPTRITKLAERTYLATNGDAIRSVGVEARGLQEQLAARGIVGGSAVGALMGLGIEYTKSRCATAAKALEDACEAHGYKPRLPDLEAAWEQLIPQTSDGVKNLLQQHIRAHANSEAVDKNLTGAFITAIAGARATAMSDLALFAARSERDQREKRKVYAERALFAITGAFVAKLPDLIPWVWLHSKALMHLKP